MTVRIIPVVRAGALAGALLSGLPLGGNARAADVRVGVLEIKPEGGVAPALGRQVTNRTAEVLSRRPGYRVLAPDDIRAILEREAQKQLLGCDDDSCLAELAGALGADVLITGRVTKLESAWAVSLTAVNPRRAEALGRVTEEWGGTEVGLLNLIDPLIDRLLAPPGQKLVGGIRVEGAVRGTRIYVDEQIRGTAPAGRLGRIEIGARRLTLSAEDYKPIERWVVVRTDQTTSVSVQQSPLDRAPFYATWWFWTVAGAAVAGAATATVLATQGSGGGDPSGVQVSINADTAFTRGR